MNPRTKQFWNAFGEAIETGGLSLITRPAEGVRNTSDPAHLEAARMCIEDEEFGLVKNYFLETGLVRLEELGLDPTKQALLTAQE